MPMVNNQITEKTRDVTPMTDTLTWKNREELDPVGSTVRYEMMKLCTGSYRTL